jgi:hypothetical protein
LSEVQSVEQEVIGRLFERRDFTYLYEYCPIPTLLHVLKAFRCEHFTSDNHYAMFKLYVKPRLQRIGKAFAARTWSERYKYLYIDVAELYFSKNYLLTIFKRYRYMLDLNHTDYGSYKLKLTEDGDRRDAYLIGFNSDGKLFVNKSHVWAVDLRDKRVKSYDHRDDYLLVIAEVDDSLIHEFLGYGIDGGDSEKIAVSGDGTYRVQGEVLMHARGVEAKSIGDIIGVDYPVGIVHDAIVDYLNRFVANELMIELTNIGFSVDYARRMRSGGASIHHAVVIPNVLTDGRDSNAAIEAVVSRLKDRMKGYEVEYDRLRRIMRIKNGFINAEISIGTAEIGEESKYRSIVFEPHVDTVTSKAYQIVFHELKEVLNRAQRQNYTVVLGNHVITVKNAISFNVEFTPSEKPVLPIISDWAVRFNLGFYYVDNISSVEIQHSEHGKVNIEFNGRFLIEFKTTNVDNNHRYEMNRAVLFALTNL